VRNKLFVANAGDCRAILSRAGKPFPMSKVGLNHSVPYYHTTFFWGLWHLWLNFIFISLLQDHVASCPKERERVIKAGTEVKWQIDTWRVGTAALQVLKLTPFSKYWLDYALKWPMTGNKLAKFFYLHQWSKYSFMKQCCKYLLKNKNKFANYYFSAIAY